MSEVKEILQTDEIVKDLMKEWSFNEQQAQWVLGVAGGEKPIDATVRLYNYTNKTNAYGQMHKLISNEKVDRALRELGFNLKDTQEKQAFGIIRALHEIAFGENITTRDKLQALKELAKFNPVLLKWADTDVSLDEEANLRKRLEEEYGS